MRKNTVRRNAKRTGMKAAILMAALLAVGTPFAVHTYNAQRQTNVQVVEADSKAAAAASTTTASTAKAATGSKTASTKASQKAQNDTVSEKTTTATTEAAASAKTAASAKAAASAKTSTSEADKAAKSSTTATTSTASASSSKSSSDTVTVVSKSMTVYATAQSGLNVRSTADASAKALGTLSYREAVKVTGSVQKNGKATGWYRVSYNGSTGYVKADYVSTTQPAAPKKDTTPQKTQTGTMTLTRVMGNGEVRTVCIWSDGSITDGNGVTYTAINACEYKSTDGYQWTEGYQVDTMILYQTMGDEVRTVCVWSDGSIYDGNGVYYTAINGYEYTSTDGLLWSTEQAENTEAEEQAEAAEAEKQAETSEAEKQAETAEAEKQAETAEAEKQEVKYTVTMTVSVSDGYLALRSSANGDSDNEIAQLQNGTSVEVSKEGLNACDKYVYVTVPSTGMTGYVNVEFLK